MRAYRATQRSTVNSDVTLWIFLPVGLSHRVPCVVIAPAGTPEIYGSKLGNPPEYIPYVRAGFAVVAYSLDGPVQNENAPTELLAGYNAFRKTYGGLYDTYAAIAYIDANLADKIDTSRIYAAGHSSAGAVALLAAELDPGIKGCLAYAPRTDLVNEKASLIAGLQQTLPGVGAYLYSTSPTTWVKKLTCPLFLFSAQDDSIVSTSAVAAFAARVSAHNSHVTFVRVPTGDHYDAMIEQGIPRGIEWLKALDARISASAAAR
jgi:dienelactone hydrolase